MLYQYLQSNYMPDEPIFASDLQVAGMSNVSIRAQLKKLTDAGLTTHMPCLQQISKAFFHVLSLRYCAGVIPVRCLK